MFFVSDNQPDRHRAIRAFLNDRQAAIAVILSAVDFEWSIRRAVLVLGRRTTKTIREEALSRIRGGNDDYKRLWKEELAGHLGITLPQAVPHWNRIVDPHRGAARLRGAILHGARGGVSVQLAQQVVDDYLLGAICLERLARQCGATLFGRADRRKERAAEDLERLCREATAYRQGLAEWMAALPKAPRMRPHGNAGARTS